METLALVWQPMELVVSDGRATSLGQASVAGLLVLVYQGKVCDGTTQVWDASILEEVNTAHTSRPS